jgi:hypothetical protein
MATDTLAVGSMAPRFTLTTIGSKRTFKLADLRGRQVLLLFINRHNAPAARELIEQLRHRQPDHEKLTVAMILDLHAVPKLLRGPAERFIEGTYAEAAALIPAPYDPADHVLLLPDWTGQLFQGYRFDPASDDMAAVLIDETGTITAVIRAADTAEQVLTLVDNAAT